MPAHSKWVRSKVCINSFSTMMITLHKSGFGGCSSGFGATRSWTTRGMPKEEAFTTHIVSWAHKTVDEQNPSPPFRNPGIQPWFQFVVQTDFVHPQ